MNELLTTKQVQDHLQVDRTTIYRMLKDGRLTGVKIGKQWRFSQAEIDDLLTAVAPTHQEEAKAAVDLLPISCLQAVQEISAESIEIGAIITDNNGTPLTRISNSCRFCELIRSSKSGRQACINSWRKLSRQQDAHPQFATCHAGFQYTQARIKLNDVPAAMLVAGQFYTELPNPESIQARAAHLAKTHNLNEAELVEALREIPLIMSRKKDKISRWLKKLADTMALITHERLDMLNRLRRIAAMSAISVKS